MSGQTLLDAALAAFAASKNGENLGAEQQLQAAINSDPAWKTQLVNDFANGTITGFADIPANSGVGAQYRGTIIDFTVGQTTVGGVTQSSIVGPNNVALTPGDLSFIGGHETSHATFSTEAATAATAFYNGLDTINAVSGVHDYTSLLSTHNTSEAKNEDLAQIRGWNDYVAFEKGQNPNINAATLASNTFYSKFFLNSDGTQIAGGPTVDTSQFLADEKTLNPNFGTVTETNSNIVAEGTRYYNNPTTTLGTDNSYTYTNFNAAFDIAQICKKDTSTTKTIDFTADNISVNQLSIIFSKNYQGTCTVKDKGTGAVDTFTANVNGTVTKSVDTSNKTSIFDYQTGATLSNSSANITLGSGFTATISGSNNYVNLGNNSVANTTATATNDEVLCANSWASISGAASSACSINSTSGLGTLTFTGTGFNAVANSANGNYVNNGVSSTIAAVTGDTITDTGFNNSATCNGSSLTQTSGTGIYTCTATGFNVSANNAALNLSGYNFLTGSTNTVSDSGGTLTDTGNSNTVNVLNPNATLFQSGTGNTDNVMASSDVLNTNSATINIAANLSDTINGNNNILNGKFGDGLVFGNSSWNDTVNGNGIYSVINGASSVNLTGTGDAAAIYGNSSVVTANGANISVANNLSDTFNGNNNSYHASNDTLILGATDTRSNVIGSNDTATTTAAFNFNEINFSGSNDHGTWNGQTSGTSITEAYGTGISGVTSDYQLWAGAGGTGSLYETLNNGTNGTSTDVFTAADFAPGANISQEILNNTGSNDTGNFTTDAFSFTGAYAADILNINYTYDANGTYTGFTENMYQNGFFFDTANFNTLGQATYDEFGYLVNDGSYGLDGSSGGGGYYGYTATALNDQAAHAGDPNYLPTFTGHMHTTSHINTVARATAVAQAAAAAAVASASTSAAASGVHTSAFVPALTSASMAHMANLFAQSVAGFAPQGAVHSAFAGNSLASAVTAQHVATYLAGSSGHGMQMQ